MANFQAVHYTKKLQSIGRSATLLSLWMAICTFSLPMNKVGAVQGDTFERCIPCNSTVKVPQDTQQTIEFICAAGFPASLPPLPYTCLIFFEEGQNFTLHLHEYYLKDASVDMCKKNYLDFSSLRSAFTSLFGNPCWHLEPRLNKRWSFVASEPLYLNITIPVPKSEGKRGYFTYWDYHPNAFVHGPYRQRKGFNFTYEIPGKDSSQKDEDAFVGGLQHAHINDCSLNGVPVLHKVADRKYRFTCECLDETTGDHCQWGGHCTINSTQKLCNGKSECRHVDGESICICEEGYHGKKCENHYTTISTVGNNCDGIKDCQHYCHKRILGGQVQAYCSCKAGYNASNQTHCVLAEDWDLHIRIRLPSTKSYRKTEILRKINETLKVVGLTNKGDASELPFKIHSSQEKVTVAMEVTGKTLKRQLMDESIWLKQFPGAAVIPLAEPKLAVGPLSAELNEADVIVFTCPVHGGKNLNVTWYKDGHLIYSFWVVNCSYEKRTPRYFLTTHKGLAKHDCNLFLWVRNPKATDHGIYTCRIADRGYIIERKIIAGVNNTLKISLKPYVKTVEQGGHISLKCITLNRDWIDRNHYIGYWKVTPQDAFTSLQPHLISRKGFKLDIYNITKPLKVTCRVQEKYEMEWIPGNRYGKVSLDAQVRVVSPETQTCPGELFLRTQWHLTPANTYDEVDCPNGYIGRATRWCQHYQDDSSPTWDRANFTRCVFEPFIQMKTALIFKKMDSTSPLKREEDLSGNFLKILQEHSFAFLPGEGGSIINVFKAINAKLKGIIPIHTFLRAINTLMEAKDILLLIDAWRMFEVVKRYWVKYMAKEFQSEKRISFQMSAVAAEVSLSTTFREESLMASDNHNVNLEYITNPISQISENERLRTHTTHIKHNRRRGTRDKIKTSNLSEINQGVNVHIQYTKSKEDLNLTTGQLSEEHARWNMTKVDLVPGIGVMSYLHPEAILNYTVRGIHGGKEDIPVKIIVPLAQVMIVTDLSKYGRTPSSPSTAEGQKSLLVSQITYSRCPEITSSVNNRASQISPSTSENLDYREDYLNCLPFTVVKLHPHGHALCAVAATSVLRSGNEKKWYYRCGSLEEFNGKTLWNLSRCSFYNSNNTSCSCICDSQGVFTLLLAKSCSFQKTSGYLPFGKVVMGMCCCLSVLLMMLTITMLLPRIQILEIQLRIIKCTAFGTTNALFAFMAWWTVKRENIDTMLAISFCFVICIGVGISQQMVLHQHFVDAIVNRVSGRPVYLITASVFGISFLMDVTVWTIQTYRHFEISSQWLPIGDALVLTAVVLFFMIFTSTANVVLIIRNLQCMDHLRLQITQPETTALIKRRIEHKLFVLAGEWIFLCCSIFHEHPVVCHIFSIATILQSVMLQMVSTFDCDGFRNLQYCTFLSSVINYPLRNDDEYAKGDRVESCVGTLIACHLPLARAYSNLTGNGTALDDESEFRARGGSFWSQATTSFALSDNGESLHSPTDSIPPIQFDFLNSESRNKVSNCMRKNQQGGGGTARRPRILFCRGSDLNYSNNTLGRSDEHWGTGAECKFNGRKASMLFSIHQPIIHEFPAETSHELSENSKTKYFNSSLNSVSQKYVDMTSTDEKPTEKLVNQNKRLYTNCYRSILTKSLKRTSSKQKNTRRLRHYVNITTNHMSDGSTASISKSRRNLSHQYLIMVVKNKMHLDKAKQPRGTKQNIMQLKTRKKRRDESNILAKRDSSNSIPKTKTPLMMERLSSSEWPYTNQNSPPTTQPNFLPFSSSSINNIVINDEETSIENCASAESSHYLDSLFNENEKSLQYMASIDRITPNQNSMSSLENRLTELFLEDDPCEEFCKYVHIPLSSTKSLSNICKKMSVSAIPPVGKHASSNGCITTQMWTQFGSLVNLTNLWLKELSQEHDQTSSYFENTLINRRLYQSKSAPHLLSYSFGDTSEASNCCDTNVFDSIDAEIPSDIWNSKISRSTYKENGPLRKSCFSHSLELCSFRKISDSFLHDNHKGWTPELEDSRLFSSDECNIKALSSQSSNTPEGAHESIFHRQSLSNIICKKIPSRSLDENLI